MTDNFPGWLQKSVIAVALALAAWFFVADLCHATSNGMATFYYASQAVKAGTDIYTSHAPGVSPQYVYPPLFSVMMLPFLHVGLMTATRFWLCLNLVVTALALWIGAREIARRFSLPQNALFVTALACSAFVLSVGEIKTEWSTGQTDVLILLPFILGLIWLEKYPILSGVALAMAGNIKYQPLLALPYLVIRRRWVAVISTVISTVCIAMLPALLLGWEQNLAYLKKAFAGLGLFMGIHSQNAANTVDLTWIRSVSITSAMGRLIAHWSINSSKAFELGGAIAIAFLLIVLRMYNIHRFRLIEVKARPGLGDNIQQIITSFEWIGLMVAWLAFGPEVSRRHMYVLLLLNLIVVSVLVAPKLQFNRWPLAVGLILFQLGLRLPPSSFTAASNGWNGVGGPSWCLLLIYGTLVWTGLALANAAVPAPEPRSNIAT